MNPNNTARLNILPTHVMQTIIKFSKVVFKNKYIFGINILENIQVFKPFPSEQKSI